MTDLRVPFVVHFLHPVVPVPPALGYPRRWFGLTPLRGWVVRDDAPAAVR